LPKKPLGRILRKVFDHVQVPAILQCLRDRQARDGWWQNPTQAKKENGSGWIFEVIRGPGVCLPRRLIKGVGKLLAAERWRLLQTAGSAPERGVEPAQCKCG
jgi:hypothetical protein